MKQLFQKPRDVPPVQASPRKRPGFSSPSASVASPLTPASATKHSNLDVNKLFQRPGGGPSVQPEASEHKRRDIPSLTPSGSAWRRPKRTKGDEGSPSAVALKVCALLNALTAERFDAISERVVAQVNRSDGARGDETLRQVTQLVFEAGAAADARWAELYARLCKMMTRKVSVKVREGGAGGGGKHVRVVSGQLFHQRLVVLCQEACERVGRAGGESTSVGSASTGGVDHAEWRARQRSVGSARFVGELFRSRIISERVMQECVQKLIRVVEAHPAEEEVERLCALLAAGGPSLESPKALAYMADVFSRLKALQGRASLSPRARFMLLVSHSDCRKVGC